jgi:hypothetical protein
MITFKKKKETERELAHTDVFLNGNYMGYYMSNGDEDGRKWVFCSDASKKEGIPYFCATTQDELKSTLNKIVNREVVTLKKHFGMVEENYVWNGYKA